MRGFREGLAGMVLVALTSGCGADRLASILVRWRHDAATTLAPPGIGPERRVILTAKAGQGEILTVNEENGTRVEGPFSPVFPTEHAPVAHGGTIVLVSSIGRVVGLNLAGETLFTTNEALGVTGPPAIADDGSIRVATTTGRLLSLRSSDGGVLFDAPIGGAAPSPLAIAPDGTTYVATDTGRLVGISDAGAEVLNVVLSAPASGPSLSSSGDIAVGELDKVRMIARDGREIFQHPRAARVVGTRVLPTGEVIAWGEDGVFEILGTDGSPIARYEAGPPIYAHAVALRSGNFAVIDSGGIAHLIARDGAELDRVELGGSPLSEISVGEIGFVFVAIGKTVQAIDFDFE